MQNLIVWCFVGLWCSIRAFCTFGRTSYRIVCVWIQTESHSCWQWEVAHLACLKMSVCVYVNKLTVRMPSRPAQKLSTVWQLKGERVHNNMFAEGEEERKVDIDISCWKEYVLCVQQCLSVWIFRSVQVTLHPIIKIIIWGLIRLKTWTF